MADIIQLLPDTIANQIAAGEVVQRPASVVKELMENAIDAGATQVTVVAKDAGKQLIQVIDNGKGMSHTDARMAFERHATSKIRSHEDLYSLRTMGFRGEALASIGAVAQVEVKTRPSEEELGTQICVEGGHVKLHEPDACPQGTNIAVKNLFFNVPARRNFLKRNPVELKHMLEEFQRIALAHPEVEFHFYQEELEVYQLKAGKLSQRIVGLLGKQYQKKLIPLREDLPHLGLVGYVGTPETARKTRGEQYFFVNDRFIKSPYLHHAVMNAYEGLLADKHYPFYVIFLNIDPKHIDVNVHPTKTEIKFDDERMIYGTLQATVRGALGQHNMTPSLDFGLDVNHPVINPNAAADPTKLDVSGDPLFSMPSQIAPNEKAQEGSAADYRYGGFKDTPLERRNLKNWETLMPEPAAPRATNMPTPAATPATSVNEGGNAGGNTAGQLGQPTQDSLPWPNTSGNMDWLSEGVGAGAESEAENPEASWEQSTAGAPELPLEAAPAASAEARIPAPAAPVTIQSKANALSGKSQETAYIPNDQVFQLHGRYILSQVKSGMMMIDQRAAHERILYEQYLKNLRQGAGASQQVLFPQRLVLNPADFALLAELNEELQALGFLLEKSGGNAVSIHGIPADLAESTRAEAPEKLLEGLLEQFKHHQQALSLGRVEAMARAMAKRTAIRHGQALQEAEMRSLINRLFASATPNFTPDGALTFYILPLNDIAQFFTR